MDQREKRIGRMRRMETDFNKHWPDVPADQLPSSASASVACLPERRAESFSSIA